jgi:hypothetical protein
MTMNTQAEEQTTPADALQTLMDDHSVVSLNSSKFDDPGINSVADNNERKELEDRIAAKESKAVRWIRGLAIAVIALSTVGVAVAVFYYMTNVENTTFRHRFRSDSHKILESIGSTFDRSLGSVDAYAVGLVTLAKQSNQTWPYVTMQNFPVQSSKILSLSKGVWFVNFHFLPNEKRPIWKKLYIEQQWVG